MRWNGTEAVPYETMASVVFREESLPPRINNSGVLPIVPIHDQIPAFRIFERVHNDFFQRLGDVENSVIATFLPEWTDNAVLPRMGCRIALESREMIKNA